MSSTDVDTWMPFYVADYLRDTRHLSATEHGAYMLLIMQAWTQGGILPLDPVRLARIAGLSREEWSDMGEMVMEFFVRTDDGYRHNRVDRELARAKGMVEQRKAAGKASAAARAARRDGNDRSTTVGTEDATDLQRNSRPSPSPSHSSLRSDVDDDDAREISAEVTPVDLPTLTDMAARAAGVRHVDPGPVLKAQDLVREWIDYGASPDEIMEAVRSVSAATQEPINSLRYFDRHIRQAVARRENSNGKYDSASPAEQSDDPLIRAAAARRAQRRAGERGEHFGGEGAGAH